MGEETGERGRVEWESVNGHKRPIKSGQHKRLSIYSRQKGPLPGEEGTARVGGVGASGMPRYQPFGEHTQAARTVFPLGWSGLVPTYIKLSTTNENKPLNGVRGKGLRVCVCLCVCWLFVLRRACRIFHSILCSAQAQKANSTPFCHILWQHSKGCC